MSDAARNKFLLVLASDNNVYSSRGTFEKTTAIPQVTGLEYPEKNVSKEGRETINSTHIFHPGQNPNPGQNGGRRVISPLCLPYQRFPHLPLVPFVVLEKHSFLSQK